MSEQRPTVSTFEAGRMLQVSDETAKRYWRRGWIEGFRSIPGPTGRLRLYRDSVEAFAERRKNFK